MWRSLPSRAASWVTELHLAYVVGLGAADLAATPKPRQVRDYKADLQAQLDEVGAVTVREHKFAIGLPKARGIASVPKTRRPLYRSRAWRFDWADVDNLIAVEYEGGTYGGKSRHTTAGGFRGDVEKYDVATELGWRVFRYTSDHVRNGEAKRQLARVYAAIRGAS